jgi:DNA processing protein
VIACIGLGLLPGIGPRTIRQWLESAGSGAEAWRTVPTLAGRHRNAQTIIAARRTLDPQAVLARARSQGTTVIAMTDPSYPVPLLAIPDPPPALFVRGEIGTAATVAVVGSRRATPYGRAVTERLTTDLAAAGICIVSGLARGIDGIAHEAALDAGGRTVAVLGSGVDVIYPREHRRLADAISSRGALVSEFAPGTPPLPGFFPRRNRLISGLAMGVVVVEGAEDSGALVTVDYALDQGRDVFAVPGSIFSNKSRAPHELLRQGARLVESGAEVLQELGLADPAAARGAGREIKEELVGKDEERVLTLLTGGPRPLDELIDESTLPAGKVAAAVTRLEMRGLVETLPGQIVMRTARKG